MRIHIDYLANFDKWGHCRALLKELEAYQKNSVRLMLDGYSSTPEEIANACLILEDGSYMRDYITDEEGVITELWFEKANDS